jgi:hypothetical protein
VPPKAMQITSEVRCVQAITAANLEAECNKPSCPLELATHPWQTDKRPGAAGGLICQSSSPGVMGG